MCWHLLRTILQDPYAWAQAIMSEWQLSFLTCGWRGCWKPRSAMTRSKAACLFFFFSFFAILVHGEKKEQIMGFTVRFNAYVSDDWTSFRCSCQGNLQIQSRYVLRILKKTTATAFPEVFSGSCAGLKIGSHVHLQSMDSITGSCNIMQSNAAQSIATENDHIFMAWWHLYLLFTPSMLLYCAWIY